MPSLKRYRVAALTSILIILALYYISYGASNTIDSPFYRRTVAAIQQHRDADARQRAIDQEKESAERRERVKKEHDGATAAAAQAAAATTLLTTSTPITAADVTDVVGGIPGLSVDAAASVPTIAAIGAQVVLDADARAKDDKVVQGKPATDNKDGVAKLGNVGTPRDSMHIELEQILAKAPLVIFSKTYCPYSKKAKHVLLDLYTVIPAPFVVELDQHEHGGGLQRALDEITHRSTVPNVLINGQSIGGGDDIVGLHERGELVKLITELGGHNITSIVRNPSSE